MLARRLTTILPAMTLAEAIEPVTASPTAPATAEHRHHRPITCDPLGLVTGSALIECLPLGTG